MILPILISVSVAPVSYFFCASAPLLEVASTMSAAEAMASLEQTDIQNLPLDDGARLFTFVPFCCGATAIQYHLRAVIKNKPLRRWSKGLVQSEAPGGA